jgi:dCTP deaminase
VSVLTRDEILKAIASGEIKVDPFESSNVGPGSIDLRLSSHFKVFKKPREVVVIDDQVDYRELTETVSAPNGLLLMPTETILGWTLEKITTAGTICGWLEGRSTFARVGLMVHISASFMQPGLDNHQCLEMTNFSPNPMSIRPGTRICQFIFERTIGSARYQGKFKDQRAAP